MKIVVGYIIVRVHTAPPPITYKGNKKAPFGTVTSQKTPLP